MRLRDGDSSLSRLREKERERGRDEDVVRINYGAGVDDSGNDNGPLKRISLRVIHRIRELKIARSIFDDGRCISLISGCLFKLFHRWRAGKR